MSSGGMSLRARATLTNSTRSRALCALTVLPVVDAVVDAGGWTSGVVPGAVGVDAAAGRAGIDREIAHQAATA